MVCPPSRSERPFGPEEEARAAISFNFYKPSNGVMELRVEGELDVSYKVEKSVPVDFTIERCRQGGAGFGGELSINITGRAAFAMRDWEVQSFSLEVSNSDDEDVLSAAAYYKLTSCREYSAGIRSLDLVLLYDGEWSGSGSATLCRYSSQTEMRRGDDPTGQCYRLSSEPSGWSLVEVP